MLRRLKGKEKNAVSTPGRTTLTPSTKFTNFFVRASFSLSLSFALQSPVPPALALRMSNLSFSIDRPFGVYLYDYFDQLYTAVTGQSASKFAFVEGVTPFSTISEGRHSVQLNGFRSLENTHVCYLCLVVVSCITYLVVIFGTQYLLRDSQPLKPQFLFRVHNFLLTIVSLALLLLLIEQLVPQLARHGLYWTICSKDAWTEKHELLYYLNYLVKYWELIDTVFLVVKKKKLGKNEGLSTCNDGKKGLLTNVYQNSYMSSITA